jgi:hypothetical protein
MALQPDTVHGSLRSRVGAAERPSLGDENPS